MTRKKTKTKGKDDKKIFKIIIIVLCLIVLYNILFKHKKKNEYIKGEYYLQFGDDFKKGLNTVDDLGISIVIAIDCSGSMDDPPKNGSINKYKLASQSLREIVSFLENFYFNNVNKENLILKIGLLKFSDDVEVLFPLTLMDKTNFEILKEVTSIEKNFLPQSSTAIGKTIEKGAEILAQSGTIFKSLIIITDGENTEGVDPEKALDALVNNRNNKSTMDFPVITSSILVSIVGFDIDASVFYNLKKIGARVVQAGDKEELDNTLRNIFIADITKLEAK